MLHLSLSLRALIWMVANLRSPHIPETSVTLINSVHFDWKWFGPWLLHLQCSLEPTWQFWWGTAWSQVPRDSGEAGLGLPEPAIWNFLFLSSLCHWSGHFTKWRVLLSEHRKCHKIVTWCKRSSFLVKGLVSAQISASCAAPGVCDPDLALEDA